MFINGLASRASQIRTLIRIFPRYKTLLFLQVLSSLTSFIGLPLLIPVINFMNKGVLGEESDPILTIIKSGFMGIGVQITLPILLTTVTILIVGGVVLNGIVLLRAQYSQYELFASGTNRLMQDYMSVRWQWLISNTTGQINHALYNETAARANTSYQALKLATTSIQLTAFTLLSFYIAWQVSLLGLAIFSIIVAFNLFAARYVKKASSEKNDEQKIFAELVQSIQQNRKFLKSSILYRSFIPRVKIQVEVLVRLAKRIAFWSQIQPVWTQGAGFLLFVVLISMHSQIDIQIEALIVLLLILVRMMPLVTSFSVDYSALASFLPVFESLESRFRSLSDNKEVFGKSSYRDGSTVRMEKVSFAYEPNRPVLIDISITLGANSTIAIVGGSGEGKSTILDLLLGLWNPDNGKIWYGEVSNEELDYYSLRERVAYVSQETTLFPGTLRENLEIGIPKDKTAKIQEICHLVYIDQFLHTLPNGLDTVIGENGIMLSGGQRQRVALGRALMMAPDILILDEATSALDVESEEMIRKTIRKLHGKLTTLIVTHRISTIKNADYIYILEEGRIREEGTYEDLVRQGGRFTELLSMQSVDDKKKP